METKQKTQDKLTGYYHRTQKQLRVISRLVTAVEKGKLLNNKDIIVIYKRLTKLSIDLPYLVFGKAGKFKE